MIEAITVPPPPTEFQGRESWMCRCNMSRIICCLRVKFYPFVPTWEWAVTDRIKVVPANKMRTVREATYTWALKVNARKRKLTNYVTSKR